MLQVTNTADLNTQINADNVADLAIQTKAATVVVTVRHHHSVSGMKSSGCYSGSTGRFKRLAGKFKRTLWLCCESMKRSWLSLFEYEPMSSLGMLLMPVQPVIVRKPARGRSGY